MFKILSAYLETILCTAKNPICNNLLKRFNTFRVLSEYAERNFHFQQCLGTSKGQYFEKIKWGGLYTCLREQFTTFIFLDIFKPNTALCVYGEYAKRRKMH
jgi:hypothetical protein